MQREGGDRPVEQRLANGERAADTVASWPLPVGIVYGDGGGGAADGGRVGARLLARGAEPGGRWRRRRARRLLLQPRGPGGNQAGRTEPRAGPRGRGGGLAPVSRGYCRCRESERARGEMLHAIQVSWL